MLGGVDGGAEGPEQTARELAMTEGGMETVAEGAWEIDTRENGPIEGTEDAVETLKEGFGHVLRL